MRVQRPPLGNWRIRPGKRRSVKIAVPRLDPGQTIGKSPDRPEATWERYFVISVAPRLVSVPAHAHPRFGRFSSTGTIRPITVAKPTSGYLSGSPHPRGTLAV
jgi:hypothetical protein